MIVNKTPQSLFTYNAPQQRLGDKTLFTTSVAKGNTQVRYFSGIDAEIYFDDIYIDEVVSIDFQVQQGAMPLFGYNSYVFDDVAVGSRMVQGSFAINFTKASYLYEVLQTLVGLQASSTKNVPTEEDDITFNNIIKENPGTNGSNLTINSHLPLWGKSFDIVVSYGDAKQDNPIQGSSMLILENAILTSCSQQLSMSGEPIYENYTFLARDIKFPPSLTNKTTTQAPEDKKIQTQEGPIVFENVAYTENLDTSKSASQVPTGVLKMSYRTNTSIKSISVEPSITLDGERGLHDVKASTASQDDIAYIMPAKWRSSIKKYAANGASTFPLKVSVTYVENGKTTTMPAMTIDVQIQEVYADL